jgi:hypothetical protein
MTQNSSRSKDSKEALSDMEEWKKEWWGHPSRDVVPNSCGGVCLLLASDTSHFPRILRALHISLSVQILKRLQKSVSAIGLMEVPLFSDIGALINPAVMYFWQRCVSGVMILA